MSTDTTFGIPSDFYPWIVSLLLHTGGYLVLALAILRLFRLTRHWSFGVLALAFLGTTATTALRLLVAARPPTVDMSEGLRASYDQVMLLGDMARTLLLFVGAVGLVLAAKQFRFTRAGETNETSTPTSPI